MKQKNDDFLSKTFPILYQNRDKNIMETTMAWGFGCGDGWFDIIADLSAELEFLNNQNFGFKVIADQVKEKFGALRFYAHIEVDVVRPERDIAEEWYCIVDDLIDRAKLKSALTCEDCGARGAWQGVKTVDIDGWIRTLCSKCREGTE